MPIDSTCCDATIMRVMREEESKKEEKFEFTSEGEVIGYISLDQARVLALEQTRDKTNSYGDKKGIELAWELLSADESEDYYDIKLSFKPAGQFQGEPGIEHIIFDKVGDLRVRQVLEEPIEAAAAAVAESVLDEVRASRTVANRTAYQSWLREHAENEKQEKGRAKGTWIVVVVVSFFLIFLSGPLLGDDASLGSFVIGTVFLVQFPVTLLFSIWRGGLAAQQVRERYERERYAKGSELGIRG